MRRTVRIAAACTASVGGLLLVLGTTAPAQAAQPDISHYSVQSSYTLSAMNDIGCSTDFTIQVTGTDKIVEQTFFDKSGTPTKHVVHDQFRGTESAKGVTLLSSEDATITDNLVTGTETWVGQPLKISLPSGGVVIRDAGRLVYNADGTIAVEHGPHPFLDGNVAAYCAAFGS